jgi:uncharacterized protein (DUF433 family)
MELRISRISASQRSHALESLQEAIMPTALPAIPPYPHVDLDGAGIPILAGTTMKIAELVMAQRAYGWSPEEIHFQHPYLSLSQIHSVLAYYWDHQSEIDLDIERRSRFVEQARREAGPSALAEKLRGRDLQS